MRKLFILAAAAGGLMALPGCAVDQTDTATESMAQQWVTCSEGDSTNMTMAALAVAMGKELGEIDPLGQLELAWVDGYQVVALRSGVCPGDCAQTQALLGMQIPDEYDWNTSCFNADNYRSNLVAKYQEQQAQSWQDVNNDHELLPVFDYQDNGKVFSMFEVYDPGCGSAATYTIKGVHSGRCLDIAWGSSDDGANAQIYDCWGGTPQQFRFEPMGEGYYRIKNVATGKCLDDWGWNTEPGADIKQYTCGDQAVQQFKVIGSGGEYSFINRHSGLALDVWGWGTANATNVAQWTYTGGDNQKFTLHGTSSCSFSGSLDNLYHRLWAFGQASNAFLSPQVDGLLWGIDPDLSDTGDTSTSSGSCMETSMCRLYDPKWNNVGGCCICNGNYGTWTAIPRAPSYLYCKL